MKAKKVILSFVVLPVVILLAVIVVGFFLVGTTLIKNGVEKAASSTLDVPVTIDNVDLSILQGKVGMEGLVIANPPGYNLKNLLEVGDTRVQVDIGSLMTDTVKIKELKLDGTKVTMEQKGLTNNLQEILDRLPKGDKAAEPKEGAKKLHIDRLEITNTNVKVKLLPVPGKADTVSINIDPIVMENLGSDNKLDTGVLTAKILAAIAMGVAKQGAGLLPDAMINGIGSTLEKTAAIGKAATEEGKKILETTTGTGKEVVEGLKGILGGKKEE